MRLPSRWRFFYTDFIDKRAVQKKIGSFMDAKVFIPSEEMCCVYLQKKNQANCSCTPDINVRVTMKVFTRCTAIIPKDIIPNKVSSSRIFFFIMSFGIMLYSPHKHKIKHYDHFALNVFFIRFLRYF